MKTKDLIILTIIIIIVAMIFALKLFRMIKKAVTENASIEIRMQGSFDGTNWFNLPPAKIYAVTNATPEYLTPVIIYSKHF